jgi:site-specific DNA recombinase
MKPQPTKKLLRCAIYTRKSTEHNLDLEFNSLDAQREACEAYIKSQAHEGWRLVRARYDDGGLSGASLDRPALQELLGDIRGGKIDVIVVYKVDRLTRSLADFAKLVELFDQHSVSFVSITQSFNTTSSMGRLTLNVLLSFAQFEREVIGERVREKICSLEAQGFVGWRPNPTRLRHREQKAGRRARGGRDRPCHIPALPPMRFGRSLGGGTGPPKDCLESPHHSQRPHPGWRPV